ncbi:alpha/beta hydrolase [Kitasatospora viridis]|uniref:Acetyl esterase/lipase n=1 Tax=Kitasatospora viridis TaxID=281105 RepID=A0A561TW57_9ACTN|nr:alpha/beta hydrolase [Kitasatospora viridis]TWF91345.1 acetyl esterase/lipase [Kitasatospora viridis]
MPIGFLITLALLALCTFAALRPPMPRQTSRSNLWCWLGYLLNEQPFLGLALLAASAPPTLTSRVGTPTWWLTAALTALPACGMAALAVRTRSARGVLEAALAAEPGIRMPASRPPVLPILLLPLLSWRPGVRRLRNRRYGDARAQRLDVYLPRSRPQGAPILLYLHGGGFVTGSKLLGARPLLYRMAKRGWVCASANYRLRTAYTDSLTDARQAIAWLREHADELGADPARLVVAGGSAGAHLAATVALTDGSVSGAIGLYGYYGPAGQDASGAPATPHAHVHADAPPFLIVHGALDTLVLAEDARHFADQLDHASSAPVAYAELPGTQHNFDFFHSLRLRAVADAVEGFAVWATRR